MSVRPFDLADQYSDQAAMLIRASLELVPNPNQRPGVSRTIAADSALDSLRGSAGFARLETELGGHPR